MMSVAKIIILGLFTVFLSSCYYSKGCWIYPQSADCSARPEVKVVQRWQKKDSIGDTDPEQRWRDFQQCGVKDYMNGTLDMNAGTPDMSANDVKKRIKEIEDCMENKNYIYFSEHECRTESQTKLNGKCN
ncbi:hypothetical protein NKT77_01035 [Moraxella sp. FZLJ2107]|uniref:hypothetical protein n=1 Tax=unclassified Moraxella TaxID=2685852 RepID=UPI0020C8F8AC|nr:MULTISPECIES: hypothetical protein [unclassified Moraxella]UTO05273.1 hypothetical protein NKT77_01035 [Moraxella sp. FZLJ2107]UTO22008.1 hypothetical protein NKU06_09335 [Moraxella sp. FZLJ2109]